MRVSENRRQKGAERNGDEGRYEGIEVSRR